MTIPSRENHKASSVNALSTLRLEQFYVAFEQSPVATAITDADGYIEYVNQRFLDITGFDRQTLLGKTPALIQSGMTPNVVYEQMWAALKAGHVWQGEILNQRRNGQLYWEVQTITPVRDADGEIVSYVAVKEDITHRHQQANELRLMSAAFEAGLATLITDADMVIQRVNQAFLEMTGYPSDEVIGQTPKLLKSGCHDKAFYRAMWQSLRATGHWQGEIVNRDKQGNDHLVWQSITAVADGEGQVSHYIAAFHAIPQDVTHAIPQDVT